MQLPSNAKNALNEITKDINNKQALEILRKAAESKKYIYNDKYGITPKLVANAANFLK